MGGRHAAAVEERLRGPHPRLVRLGEDLQELGREPAAEANHEHVVGCQVSKDGDAAAGGSSAVAGQRRRHRSCIQQQAAELLPRRQAAAEQAASCGRGCRIQGMAQQWGEQNRAAAVVLAPPPPAPRAGTPHLRNVSQAVARCTATTAAACCTVAASRCGRESAGRCCGCQLLLPGAAALHSGRNARHLSAPDARGLLREGQWSPLCCSCRVMVTIRCGAGLVTCWIAVVSPAESRVLWVGPCKPLPSPSYPCCAARPQQAISQLAPVRHAAFNSAFPTLQYLPSRCSAPWSPPQPLPGLAGPGPPAPAQHGPWPASNHGARGAATWRAQSPRAAARRRGSRCVAAAPERRQQQYLHRRLGPPG